MKHFTRNFSTSQHHVLLTQSHIVHHTHVCPARTHEDTTMTKEVKIGSTGAGVPGTQ